MSTQTTGISFKISAEFGYIVALVLAFYIQQAILFVLPVGYWRRKTGIQPPTMYPNDSQLKELKVSPEDFNSYSRAQRVHQNNMEFLTIFLPALVLAGLYDPVNAAVAGAIAWVGRLATGIGYLSSAGGRVLGAWFHIPEIYILFLLGKFAFELISRIQ